MKIQTTALPALFWLTTLEFDRGLLGKADTSGSDGGWGGSGIAIRLDVSSWLIVSRLFCPELVPCLFLRSGFAFNNFKAFIIFIEQKFKYRKDFGLLIKKNRFSIGF